MPQEQNFSSNNLENLDFPGGFGSFNNFNASASSATPMSMGPPPTLPSAVQPNMPFQSTPSTRNASFMSQSSSQGNAFASPQTPMQTGYNYDGAYGSQPSSQDSWLNVGNAAMMAYTPIQGMNEFDLDFLNMESTNGGGFQDDFNVSMAEALRG